jgi:tRNA (mo5U34)-methyltransferase
MLDDATARRLIDDSDFVWHQQFHLSENVLTPGAANIEWLIGRVGLPLSLEGRTFLDVGTTNGGAAFIAEARGADRVVAVDIYDPDNFGFDTLRAAVGSRAEFVKGTIYELPEALNEQFDEVFFLGVLYHLRHPLLALDSLRRLTRGNLYVETAVSGSPTEEPRARFFRRDELGGDGSNWFAPTISCLVDWVESSGFVVDRVDHWPSDQPARAFVAAHPAEDPPEFEQLSYEVPLTVTASPRLE